MDSALAVKSFIVHEKKTLLLKRRPNDVHQPGSWDIPGGRLSNGENPYDGIRRETREETGLEIEIVCPVAINHFDRDDGQRITMIIFLCKPQSGEIQLSEEHTEYAWVPLHEVPEFFKNVTQTIEKFNMLEKI